MRETIKEFLSERRLVSRGMVLVIALVGAFAGATLMFMIALAGIVG